jgi:hypothetical protein
MTQEQRVKQLENQLEQVLDAYRILEEHVCEFIHEDDDEENETLLHAQSIVAIAMHIDNQ